MWGIPSVNEKGKSWEIIPIKNLDINLSCDESVFSRVKFNGLEGAIIIYNNLFKGNLGSSFFIITSLFVLLFH